MNHKKIVIKINKMCEQLTLRIPKIDFRTFIWDYKDLSRVPTLWVLLFSIFHIQNGTIIPFEMLNKIQNKTFLAAKKIKL